MSRRDFRSHDDRRTGTTTFTSQARRLHQRAGRPPAAARHGLFEALENRVLLAGDHPSFSDFPLADTITLDAAGEGSISGLIEAPGQDDMLKFTAPANDFVTVLADTVNFLGGSSLNSKIEVYTADGGGNPVLLTTASGNGVLAGGTPTDAWAGFLASAGTTYYIRVLADVPLAFGSAGGYNLRVDAKTTPVTLDGAGSATLTGSIARLQQDQIYRVTAPVANLLTALADTPAGLLDSRLEFFDSTGAPLGGASSYPTVPSGTSTDGFVGFETVTSEVYYIRVRSDSFNDTSGTGSFTLRINIDVADPDTPAITPVTISSGAGTAAGSIATSGEQDVFKFSTTGADFTTILADTINAGTSLLDSRLEVFDASTGQLLRFSADNGILSSGLAYDPWAGFVSTAGRTYLVRVRADSTIGAGLQDTGDFDLRITTGSTALNLNAQGEATTAATQITRLEQDFIFRIVKPAGASFSGLAIANALAVRSFSPIVDARVEIFDKNGVLVAFDSESGFLNDASATWVFGASSEPYYARVRSDEFARGSSAGLGRFTLHIDAAASPITIDPVSRISTVTGGTVVSGTRLYSLTAAGSGTGLIQATSSGFFPIADIQASLYNSAGDRIAFSDDFSGTNAQISALVTGGETYYLVVDNFKLGGAEFVVYAELHTTFDSSIPIDDHASGIDYANATPIAWNPLKQATVATPTSFAGAWSYSPSQDHSRVVVGTGQGRSWLGESESNSHP